MIDSQDVNEEELQILKGDAIGDNLCSEKWMITTLMSMYEISNNKNFTEDVEERLCTLWDLSMEEAVVLYLESHNFLNIAKNILETCDESRLIEMILGIVGNMCCNDNVIDTICHDKHLMTQILSRLRSDDSAILIQLLRIVQSITWQIQTKSKLNWITYFTECNFFADSIIFMLNSSTNDDLLTAVIKMLSSMSQINLDDKMNFLRRLFKVNDLIPALLESFMQRISIEKGSHCNSDLEFIENWLQILTFVLEDLFKSENFNDESISRVIEIMYRILKPYEESYNLIPLHQITVNIIFEVVHILLSFHKCDTNISPKLDHIVACIVFFLKTDTERKELDPEDLSTYLSRYLLDVIKICTREYIIDMLHLCKDEVREFIISHIQSHPDLTSAIRNKIEETAIFTHF